MTELPEIEAQIETGSLNITNLSKVQSFMRAEKAVQQELSKDQKLALLLECENKPTRELAKELIQKSHQPALLAEKFQMTAVVQKDDSFSLEYSKFDALLDSETRELLKEFKDFYAHELPDGANISVLKLLLNKAVQFKKKKLGLDGKDKNVSLGYDALLPLSPNVSSVSGKKKSDRKYTLQRKVLPVAVKRFVWQRAGACCEHVDLNLKSRCGSKFALQPDHIIPLALGGTDEVSNLRLLCRAHNSRRAVKTFGIIRK